MSRVTDPATIRDMIGQHEHWYHTIELAPGIRTPGIQDSAFNLGILDRLGLPRDCTGMRVLDVGCRDGFFSFEMERRGAEVVGVDYVAPTNTGFSIAQQILGSHVRYIVANLYDISPDTFGTFDIVLFLGVLYHLRNPMLALDRMRAVVNPGGFLFVETHIIDNCVVMPDGSMRTLRHLSKDLMQVPLMQFFPRGLLNNDATNVWAPNMACLSSMLQEAEFRVTRTELAGKRGFASAEAVTDSTIEYYRNIDSGLV